MQKSALILLGHAQINLVACSRQQPDESAYSVVGGHPHGFLCMSTTGVAAAFRALRDAGEI